MNNQPHNINSGKTDNFGDFLRENTRLNERLFPSVSGKGENLVLDSLSQTELSFEERVKLRVVLKNTTAVRTPRSFEKNVLALVTQRDENIVAGGIQQKLFDFVRFSHGVISSFENTLVPVSAGALATLLVVALALPIHPNDPIFRPKSSPKDYASIDLETRAESAQYYVTSQFGLDSKNSFRRSEAIDTKPSAHRPNTEDLR